ncbi:glutathione S-transferase [Bradyrhizobium japonicum]
MASGRSGCCFALIGRRMMKLYFAPGACSIGIHYLLQEIGCRFELRKVDIRNGENFQAWYTAVNPKRKVPALERADGSVLTEFPVIARYLAEQTPSAGLMPAGPETLLSASELTEFIVSTIHMQGFSRAFRPGKFAMAEADHEATQARGRAIIQEGFLVVDRHLRQNTGPSFADGALFYTLFWACERLKLDVPPACAARWSEFKSRPSARRVFAAEGIDF